MPWLLTEIPIVGAAAWLAVRALGCERGLVAAWVDWLLLALWLVAASAVVLGWVGQFHPAGFVCMHLLLLLGLAVARRSEIRGDVAAALRLPGSTLARVRGDRAAGAGAAALAGFLVATGVLAGLAEPVVYDALTYRLARIGHWLQESRIDALPSNDPRQNYMPVAPDVVMSWLIAGTESGWRPAALAQWAGGVLLLLATLGLARMHGMSVAAALGAALLCATLANVAPQFTTVHTDLFTAGVFMAAWYRWESCIREQRGSATAGLGAGLALASKGTVFYLAPAVLLWLAWAQWRTRAGWSAWWPTIVGTVVSALVLAAPGFGRNWREFGNVLGPAEFVAMHHQGGDGIGAKTALNLRTSLAQNLEPHSQPPGLRTAAAAAAHALADALPEQDAFAYESLNRRETVLAIVTRATPDADATAFGVIVPFLFMLGSVLGAARMGVAGRDMGIIALGVFVFLVFFHAMQQWHPYGFRYFVLVAPWMALVAAWLLQALPRYVRVAGWTVALGSGAIVATHVLLVSHQAGWSAAMRPTASRGYFVASGWGEWSEGLVQQGVGTLHVALPFNRPLAGLYRRGDQRLVVPLREGELTDPTAEAALRRLGGGWLIVPAARYLGREGGVCGETWLFGGELESPFSLAAYRAAGEAGLGPAIIYRDVVRREGPSVVREFLVRPGADGLATLALGTAGTSWDFEFVTPLEKRHGRVSSRNPSVSVRLLPQQVSEVRITLRPAEDEISDSGRWPEITFR